MDEKDAIDNLLGYEIGEISWYFEPILKRYLVLKDNEQYKRIVEAINTIDDAAKKLYEQIKQQKLLCLPQLVEGIYIVKSS